MEIELNNVRAFTFSFEFQVLGSAKLGPPPLIFKPNFDLYFDNFLKLHDYSLPQFTLLLFPIKCSEKYYPGMTYITLAFCLLVKCDFNFC